MMSELSEPPTNKGRRAAEAWRQAGKQAFGNLGFLKTKISDMAEIAGMASASFYNYYATKEELLLALAAEYNDEVLSRIKRDLRAGDAQQNIRAIVETFWSAYTENQGVMHGVFQLSMIDEQFAAHWKKIRQPAMDGIMSEIRRAKRVSPSPMLDTSAGAIALSSMVEHFCYLWSTDHHAFLDGKSDEVAISTISDVWYRALYAVA